MASSPSQRLRRMAEKAARRKVVVAHKRKAETALAAGHEARQVAEAALAPVTACVMADGLFADGMGSVILARTMPSGLVGASFFLLDAWCLGVKNAFFEVMTQSAFEEKLEATERTQDLVDVDPQLARKLVEGAVAYAGSFGLAPHPDYDAASVIFGDIIATEQSFSFGKDGKPLFMSGPSDSRQRIRYILDRLSKSVGPDGFDYMIAAN